MSDTPPSKPEEQPPEPESAGERGHTTPEDFEDDPARNPDDERLKDIKGG